MVYTLEDHVPDTPDGAPERFAPEALAVLYFISSMAELTATVCAVLLEAEARAMVGRAFTVMVPAFSSLVQPFVLVTVTVKAVLASNGWVIFLRTVVVLAVLPIVQL